MAPYRLYYSSSPQQEGWDGSPSQSPAETRWAQQSLHANAALSRADRKEPLGWKEAPVIHVKQHLIQVEHWILNYYSIWLLALAETLKGLNEGIMLILGQEQHEEKKRKEKKSSFPFFVLQTWLKIALMQNMFFEEDEWFSTDICLVEATWG